MQREKIEVTIERTEKALERYQRPGVLCSFGKDSLVLVHLLRHLRLPVVVCRPLVFREPEWRHAWAIVQQWKLEVRLVQPAGAALAETPEGETLVTRYSVAPGCEVAWGRRVSKERADVACALSVLEQMPPPGPLPDCDVLACGHKNGDPDFAGGWVRGLGAERMTGRGVDFLFPLHDWTDAEVWAYAAAQRIPLDPARYDVPARRERVDTLASNDRVPLCTACACRHGPDRVPCPLREGRTIRRRADRLDWVEHPTVTPKTA